MELWSNVLLTFPLMSMSLIGHLTLLLMYDKARLLNHEEEGIHYLH